MIVGFLCDVYQGGCGLKCGTAGLQVSRGVCGEARRGCEEVCVASGASLGCDCRVSTAICVKCFFLSGTGVSRRTTGLEAVLVCRFFLLTRRRACYYRFLLPVLCFDDR